MMCATRPNHRGRTSTPARAFTLIELLVVILIILLVSAVALPTVLSGIRQRQVSEAARTFQAALAGARDAAISNNAPRGIRLLPDQVLTVPAVGNVNAGSTTWACDRFIPIEPAPDYREGRVIIYQNWISDSAYSQYYQTATVPTYGQNVLCVLQSFTDSNTIPVELTSWAWNLRIGDKIQFQDEGNANSSTGTGHIYTVVGPVVTANPENFINYGNSVLPTPSNLPVTLTPPAPPEFLLLVNGVDDDGDGFVDYGFDGVDNNNNNSIDTYDLIELSTEAEKWLGAQASEAANFSIMRYVAKRRPIVARGARETLFPANVVIDLTTWNKSVLLNIPGLLSERSRLPIDGISRSIDVLVDPSGQIIQTTSFSSPASYISPFLHFWLTDREGVVAPNLTLTTGTNHVLLPMPEGTQGYTSMLRDPGHPQYLEGERMLITIFARTGNMTINSLQFFNDPITGLPNINAPFFAAQQGMKEAP